MLQVQPQGCTGGGEEEEIGKDFGINQQSKQVRFPPPPPQSPPINKNLPRRRSSSLTPLIPHCNTNNHDVDSSTSCIKSNNNNINVKSSSQEIVVELSVCHCCGIRLQPPPTPLPPPPPPPTTPSQSLRKKRRRRKKKNPIRPLRSLWRVLLLCPSCFSSIGSSSICSYCLHPFSSPPTTSTPPAVRCVQCLRTVHLECIPFEHRYLVGSSLKSIDLDNFFCMDCCPLPNFHATTSLGGIASSKMEEMARDADSKIKDNMELSAMKREIAANKAMAANCSFPRAKGTLGAMRIPGSNGEEDNKKDGEDDNDVSPDEKLARELHLAMNGSRRIVRSPGSAVSNSSVMHQCQKEGGSRRGRKRCANAEICVQNRSYFDAIEGSTELDNNINGHSRAMTIHFSRACLQRPLKCHSNPISVVLALESVRAGAKVRSSNSADRYLNKYSKRKSASKEKKVDTIQVQGQNSLDGAHNGGHDSSKSFISGSSGSAPME